MDLTKGLSGIFSHARNVATNIHRNRLTARGFSSIKDAFEYLLIADLTPAKHNGLKHLQIIIFAGVFVPLFPVPLDPLNLYNFNI